MKYLTQEQLKVLMHNECNYRQLLDIHTENLKAVMNKVRSLTEERDIYIKRAEALERVLYLRMYEDKSALCELCKYKCPEINADCHDWQFDVERFSGGGSP